MNDYITVTESEYGWHAVLMHWHDTEREYEMITQNPCNHWMTRDGGVRDAKDWAYNTDLEYHDE